MTREPEKTSPITAEYARWLQKRLHDLSGVARGCAEVLEKQKLDHLWVFKKKTGDKGVEDVGKFAEEIERSLKQLADGKPFGPDESKSKQKKKASRRKKKR